VYDSLVLFSTKIEQLTSLLLVRLLVTAETLNTQDVTGRASTGVQRSLLQLGVVPGFVSTDRADLFLTYTRQQAAKSSEQHR
jgi:hypothetical protein